MTDDREALLLAHILAHPEDDAVRLILADWWDENGQPERAEFCRVQCELAPFADRNLVTDPGLARRLDTLRRREGELLGAYGATWARPVAGSLGLERWENSGVTCGPGDPKQGTSWEWRRGFVGCVTCAAADWLAHGPAVVACQPVTRVTLAGRAPAFRIEGWQWWRSAGEETDCIPPDIFARLRSDLRGLDCVFYRRKADALRDLSRAAVAFGRAAAGLPPAC